MQKKLLVLIGFLCVLNNYGQTKIQNIDTYKSGLEVIINDYGYAKDENELIKIIVEFKDLPSVKLSKSLRKTEANSMRVTQFASDLKSISEKFKNSLNKVTLQNVNINKEFYKVFSGVQIDVPQKYLSYISGLSYVKKIHLDQKISAYLDESIPLINADKIWQNLNNKGQGIKISIIDTGIDYMHDALGHGYGSNYKVIGGYDFVNNDNDPMDDNGHGTHVAGTAAANSFSLKGVAPDASLIACKVLDAKGNGYTSSIVEAIEYSIDPNNDGDYSDAADVINLSLGGYGTPDDPSSQAVNNATEIGVIVCVAAGNDGGLGFHTIGSPGCAEKAITVGNANKSKSIEYSSSKGPNTINFFIKPDLLAPGVNIKSAKLSGGVINLTGTSMATPHLAGVCALIKKQYPKWTTEEIKAAVKTTAEKLNYEPMEQGNGFLNAYKAITIKTFAIPADLSFGKCDTINRIWAPTKNLKIKNISSDQQQYNVNISSPISGITLTTDKTGFSLLPGDSTEIQIKMNVDNNLIGFRNSGSNSYSGYFKITSARDTLSLPWAFIKRQMIELKFEYPNASFCLASDSKRYTDWNATWPDLYTAQLNVPNGNYNFISRMNSNDTTYLCVKKNLNLTGTNVISVSKNESKNKIHMDGKDEYGRKFTELEDFHYFLILYDKDKLNNLLAVYQDNVNRSYFVSDIPENFLLYCYEYDIEGKQIYRVVSHEPVSNVVSDIYFTNNPEELVKQKVKFIYDKSAITPAVSYNIIVTFGDKNLQPYRILTDLGIINNVANKYWEGYVVRNEIKGSNSLLEFNLKALNAYPPAYDWTYSFSTQPFYVRNNRLFMSTRNELTPDIFTENDPSKPIIIGDDLIFARSEYFVSLNYFEQRVYFTGQMGDTRSLGGKKYKYRVYNSSGAITNSGETEIVDKFNTSWDNNYLKTEYYQTDHSRFTDNSLTMLTSIIRNNPNDMIPPSITSFQIRNSAGKPVDEITADEKIQIRFSLKDQKLNESSVKLEIKDYSKSNWIQCNLEKIAEHDNIGSLFAASLDSSKYKDINLLSVRISGEDNNANSCSWLSDPAIRINKGNYYSPKFSQIGNYTIMEDDTLSVNFVCTDKDNDPIYYHLTSDKSNSKFEVSGSMLKVIPKANWSGTDDIYFLASDGKYSDTTKFRLTVTPVNDKPSKFILLNPQSEHRVEINKSNEKDSLYFSWSKSSDIDGDSLRYKLILKNESGSVDSAVTTKNSIKYSYTFFNQLLINNHKENSLIAWSVLVSDGSDTIYADNNSFKLFISSTVTLVEGNDLPTQYYLYNAYPNPFNPETIIKYDIPELSNVELILYDLLGKEIRTLVKEEKPAGNYKIRFDGSELSSGIYFYKLQSGSFIKTKKIVLLK